MIEEPIELSAALAGVDSLWNPQVVARLNDYDIKVVRVAGDFVWHTHDDTDELFLVIDGEVRIGLRDADGEREVALPAGSLFVVPRGVEHRPTSTGASILLLEPAGTVNVGDRHQEVPEHITTTAGRTLT